MHVSGFLCEMHLRIDWNLGFFLFIVGIGLSNSDWFSIMK